MEITDFKRILTAFADQHADVDVSQGKVVAQIRDELIEAKISYSRDETRSLRITENDQEYPARTWLINRVAKVPQLAERLISGISAQEASSKLPFVSPSGQLLPDLGVDNVLSAEELVPDALNTMMEKASVSIPGATSVMYITSDAGEGKTTVMMRAALRQAEHYRRKLTNSLIVPIPLSGRAFLTFDDAVIAALVNKWRFNYLYFESFLELVKLGVVVPAFDGYEEMLVEGSRGEAISALGTLVQYLNSSGTIFIAARKAFFEYVSFKTQARLLDAIGDRSASFSRLTLDRWTKAKFCEYGVARKVVDPEKIYEPVAARLGKDHPLLTRAVLIRRLYDVAVDIEDSQSLVTQLGKNPQDYFFTFVNAIIEREANEKWLVRASGAVMEPLISVAEHHQLLGQIAQEMWQSSTDVVRLDVLDVIVEMFVEATKKPASIGRQIKERIKQHSLLVADPVRGQSVAFDHEDFQDFYLGEGLGHLLARGSRAELQAFLSVNKIPPATAEQAVKFVMRTNGDLSLCLHKISAINSSEADFSFCKENCGSLAIRISECIAKANKPIQLVGMIFPPGSIGGRLLKNVTFENCYFQPTGTSDSVFENTNFLKCSFERIEVEAESLKGTIFAECRIECMVYHSTDEHLFDPQQIQALLLSAGALSGDHVPVAEKIEVGTDDRIKVIERMLRVFQRSTQAEDEVIRLKLGKNYASLFFDEVLPELLRLGVLEEVTWAGRGIRRRFKLNVPMTDIVRVLEHSQSDFNEFRRGFG